VSPLVATLISLSIDAINAFREGRMADGAAIAQQLADLAKASDIAHDALNAEIDAALARGTPHEGEPRL
jgi:cytochrome c-type biogenesis protein CcmH/NrfG